MKPAHNDLVQCMDYLHGDVAGNEFQAACFYEYARESRHIKYAARLHRHGLRLKQPGLLDEVMNRAENKFGTNWFIQHPWFDIWTCSSFPALSWNRLPDEIRRALAFHFPPTEAMPLCVNKAGILKSLGVLARLASENAVHQGLWTHVIFTVDCSKTRKKLIQQFAAWLDQPENVDRLAKHHRRNVIGTTGGPQDRLKDLAQARLFRAIGHFEKFRDFTERHRKKDASGVLRPYHDSRHGQLNTPLNAAPICSAESVVRTAIARMEKYKKVIMPGEFDRPPAFQLSPESKKLFLKISKRFS